MKCMQCRNGISKADWRKAKVQMENGKLKAAYHFNCWELKQRIELLKATNRMPKNAYEVKGNNQDDKAAQERIALAARQAERDEQSQQEARPESWDDYRDTGTVEV